LERVWPTCHLIFTADGLVRATLQYPAEAFDFISHVLRERYGPPNAANKPTLADGTGAKVTDDVIGWSLSEVEVIATPYGASPGGGLAIITSRKWLDAEAGRSDIAAKKAATAF
jgi:hypothetical protein